MVIDPYWAGVLSTIFVEMVALIVAGVYRSIKKK